MMSRRQILATAPSALLLGLGGCGGGGGSGSESGTATTPSRTRTSLTPGHPALALSDGYAWRNTAGTATCERPVFDAAGMHLTNPGARVQFHSDSRDVTVRLQHTDRMSAEPIFSGAGCVMVDEAPYAHFEATFGQPGEIELNLAFDAIRPRRFEVLLPAIASVEVGAIEVDAAAQVARPATAQRPRWAALGDSITHGLGPSSIERTWACRLARAQGWELLNGGYAGYPCIPGTATALGGTELDIATYNIGTNDWAQQVPLAEFRSNLKLWLSGFRSVQPLIPLYLITPTWFDASRPVPLEAYRQQVREVVAEEASPLTRLIEGPTLAGHDRDRFPDGVHPGDDGSEEMAGALLALLAS